MDVVAFHKRHPLWAECPVCDRWFTADNAFGAHMTSTISRTCQDPAKVQKGKQRLVPIAVDGVEVWRWQTGDTPPVFSTPRAGVEADREAPSGHSGGSK